MSESTSDRSAVRGAFAGAEPARRPACIPTLRSERLDHASYARTTCFQAGYLVSKNAGWRNVRPVVDRQACTGCLQCYLYCPDGTIYKVSPDAVTLAPAASPDASAQAPMPDAAVQEAAPTASASESAPAKGTARPAKAKDLVAVDYDFCKGCGVCAKMCKFGAIAMVSEQEALAAEARAAAEAQAVAEAPTTAEVPATAESQTAAAAQASDESDESEANAR